jgi:iron complex transport system ATP-binding protein
VLEARGLTLKRGARTLLSALDFRVNAGEFWCVLGPNGSGKTTLLHALAGLDEAAAPCVWLNNVGLGAMALDAVALDAVASNTVALNAVALNAVALDELARLRSLMPQATQDAFSSSALETVLLARAPWQGLFDGASEEDLHIAKQCLEDADLAGFFSRDVVTLSGGERQRVAFAQTLAQDASLMLLDEPASHQDLRHQALIFSKLATRAALGKTIIASVHDLNLAARYASHVLLMDGEGGFTAGTRDEVMTVERLSHVFATRVEAVTHQGRTLFVAM